MPAYSPSSASGVIEVRVRTYPTTLTLNIPSTVEEETDFTASGVLAYIRGTSAIPLPNRPITLIVRDSGGLTVSQTTATTNAQGAYSAILNIALAGTYTIIASFIGATGLSPSIAEVSVNIGLAVIYPLAVAIAGASILAGILLIRR